MRHLLLGIASAAAITIPTAPSLAQSWTGQALNISAASKGFVGVPAGTNVRVHRGSRPGFGGGHRDGRHRHDRDFDDRVAVGEWWGWDSGAWALYNNRTWERDSYNDWWHDAPERAYPRWMSANQNCQRMWWSGGGWRC